MLVGYLIKADPGATMTFVAGGALKPIGGHILSHASATRMFLRKGVCIAMCGSVAVEDPRSWTHRRRADKLRHVFAPKVAPKSVWRSSSIVRIDLKARRRTNWTKAAGPTYNCLALCSVPWCLGFQSLTLGFRSSLVSLVPLLF